MKINCLLLSLHPCEKCDLRSRCFMLWKKKAFDLAQYYKEACERIVILKKQQLDLIDVHDREISRLREELKHERNLRNL